MSLCLCTIMMLVSDALRRAMVQGRPERIKDALMTLVRASRRERQRRNVRLDSER